MAGVLDLFRFIVILPFPGGSTTISIQHRLNVFISGNGGLFHAILLILGARAARAVDGYGVTVMPHAAQQRIDH